MLLGCKKWCRLCGNDTEIGINIFIKTEYFSTASDAIQKLLSIKISNNDVIPTEICNECNTILYTLINFYTRCQETQEMYAQILYDSENLKNQTDLNNFRINYKLLNKKELINLSLENVEIKYEENENEILENNHKNQQSKKKNPLSKHVNNKQYKTKCTLKASNNKKPSSSLSLNECIETIKSNMDCNIYNENNSNNSEKQVENLSSSSPTIIYCEICEKVFMSNRGYGIHLKIKHSIHRKPIECKYCGKTFKLAALLKKHENSHLPTDKKKFYPCNKCDKKFSSDSGLWSHMHTVHEKNRSVICEECGKGFPTSSYLKSHKLSHKKENDLQCPKCPMKLKRKKTLMIHLQTHGENFICPICGMQLNTKKTLRDHMVVHSDEKKFKCNICDKSFKREKTLNSHLILHTGIKPYECEFCKKRFSHGSNFRTHQKNTHPLELADREAKGEKRICKEYPKAKLLKEFNKNK